MRVVLDTNCLLISIAKKSVYRPVFDALLNDKFELVLSVDILLEYEEIIARKSNAEIAHNIIEVLLNRDNVIWQEVYFQFKLISKDPDDNKFVDVYVASNADYLVTNDSDYNKLKDHPFPPIIIITIEEFTKMLFGL